MLQKVTSLQVRCTTRKNSVSTEMFSTLQEISCNVDFSNMLVAQCATNGTFNTLLLSVSVPSWIFWIDVSFVVSGAELSSALSCFPKNVELCSTPLISVELGPALSLFPDVSISTN